MKNNTKLVLAIGIVALMLTGSVAAVDPVVVIFDTDFALPSMPTGDGSGTPVCIEEASGLLVAGCLAASSVADGSVNDNSITGPISATKIEQGEGSTLDADTLDGMHLVDIIALTTQSCGNSTAEPQEECDDGNQDNTDSCLNTCTNAKCGDGYFWRNNEECDDGNLTDGDFCSSSCQRECFLGSDSTIDGNSCYMSFATPLTWSEAYTACATINSHLVSLSTAGENAIVSILINGTPEAWTSLTDQYGEGTFLWDLSPGNVLAPPFLNWAISEPDNDPNGNADCAYISETTTEWFDDECDSSRPYVCEYEY